MSEFNYCDCPQPNNVFVRLSPIGIDIVRVIIPNEHLASGTDEPCSTWRSLNQLRVKEGRFRTIVKMWKLSGTDACDCGESQTVSNVPNTGSSIFVTMKKIGFSSSKSTHVMLP